MLSYGFSIRGKAHVDTGVVCQDSNIHTELMPGVYLAVAADGVGSALHSDIASGLAVEKLVKYVKQHIQRDASIEMRIACLQEGFQYAEDAIESYAVDCGDKINEYDTTLHAAIYDGRRVVYGHAGDGGILVRTLQGKTLSLTTPQKGSDGVSVMPLRAGAHSWAFGYFAEDVAAVMLVTDGILERVIMPYLLNLPATREEMQFTNREKSNVYLSATEFFMNPDCVLNNKGLENPLALYEYFLTGEFQTPSRDWQRYLDCLKSGYANLYGNPIAEEICQTLTASVPLWNIEDTTDDKTVVCLINDHAKLSAPAPGYFMEPDWAKLRQHYEHLLYPSGLGQDQESPQTNSKLDRIKKTGSGRGKGGSGKTVLLSILLILFVCALLLGVGIFVKKQLQKDGGRAGNQTDISSELSVMEDT